MRAKLAKSEDGNTYEVQFEDGLPISYQDTIKEAIFAAAEQVDQLRRSILYLAKKHGCKKDVRYMLEGPVK